jgi:hypothetical protein
MTINLGTVSLDEAHIIRQLRTDMKDDWFPDPLLNNDIIDADKIRVRIERNFDSHHGRYVAGKRDILNVPKPNFTIRYGLEVSLDDRIVYQGLAAFLAPYFDPLIPWYVFSHRRDPHRGDDRAIFRAGVPAWRDFVGAVDSATDSDTWLLSTDLTNYFDNINLPILKNTLLELLPKVTGSPSEKGQIRAHIDTLFDCLQSWTFEPTKGLPQNRDASSFLANLYMVKIDAAMRAEGYEYFRYMDDIKIVCKSEHRARRALKTLIIHLRELGLAVNSKKTEIIKPGDFDRVRDCLEGFAPEIDQLEALWSTKKRGPISQSFPLLRQAAEKLLTTAGNVDTRQFRYCIARLITLTRTEEFFVPESYFAEITRLITERLPHCPAAADQFTRYLRSVPLTEANLDAIAAYLADPEQSFYNWQNYRLWVLLGQRSIRRSDLVNRAIELISTEADGATRAGASIYLGAMGETPHRILLAEKFHTLKSYLGQRSALISLQELPFDPYIKTYVAPSVRTDLYGVYRNLRSSNPIYFAPMEPMSITQFIDGERDYA